MNIAIDVQPLYSWHRLRGIGSFTRDLIISLLEKDKNNHYYLINFYGEVPVKDKVGCHINAKELNYYEKAKPYLSEEGSLQSRIFFSDLVCNIVNTFRIDLYLLCTAVDQYDIYRADFFSKVKFVTIVHDLIPLIYARQYLDTEYAYKYLQCLTLYAASDAVLAVSKSAAKDVCRLLGYEKSRTWVIYEGISSHFKKITYCQSAVKAVLDKFFIQKEYLLCVGADDFRKNLDGLAHAFLRLPECLADQYQLVIACSVSQQTQDRILTLAKKYKRSKAVVFTGYIDDDEMLCLLNHAKLAVFPSMYEGFGLPVVEAFQCEVPVLTSNNSSLGEIAKDAAVTVDPFSVTSIKEGIVYALTKADLNQMIQKGIKECQKYRWDHVSDRILYAFRNIMCEEKTDHTSANYRRTVKQIRNRCIRYTGLKIRIKRMIKQAFIVLKAWIKGRKKWIFWHTEGFGRKKQSQIP